MTPTQRTIKALKDQGQTCGIVERFNAHVGKHGIRQDLFGCIDIIALDPDDSARGVVGIQSTGQDFAGHIKKMTEERNQEVFDWLNTAGTRLELWGWRKVKFKRGGKAMRWKPRIADFTLAPDGTLQVTERK